MGKKILRTILLLGMLGAIGWYVWTGLTTTSEDEWSNPWLDNLFVPGIAVGVFLPISMVIQALGSVRLGGGNSAALRDAPIGIGTINTLRRTGLSINDQPQFAIGMTVRTADGRTFDSVAKEIVDLTELAVIVPGAVLPVRYRPERTDEVEIDKSGDQARIQAVHNQVMIRAGLSSPRSIDIAQRGTRADAVVAAARPTGRIVGGNPELAITLMVNRPDGSTYETTVEKVLAANLVGHVQTGRVVTACYLPDNEQEVVLQLPANPHL